MKFLIVLSVLLNILLLYKLNQQTSLVQTIQFKYHQEIAQKDLIIKDSKLDLAKLVEKQTRDKDAVEFIFNFKKNIHLDKSGFFPGASIEFKDSNMIIISDEPLKMCLNKFYNQFQKITYYYELSNEQITSHDMWKLVVPPNQVMEVLGDLLETAYYRLGCVEKEKMQLTDESRRWSSLYFEKLEELDNTRSELNDIKKHYAKSK